MKIKLTYLLLLLIVFTFKAQAASDTLKVLPGQFTFVYPMGTSGAESAKTEYFFSLNALVGVTGGIKGIEIGGIMNTVNNNVYGAQFAGIMNVTQKDFLGIQGAGIINVTNGEFIGIQDAGVVNITERNFKGIQTSGVVNICNEEFVGAQAAGVANISNGKTQYIQAAGVVNITNGDFEGLQASGVANINNGEVKGLQVAGVINVAQKLNGVQIGLINVCDTIESGLPIGLINITGEGGYHEWELSTSDYANIRLSYKSGVKKFYTIYSLGYNFLETKQFISGFGVGHIVSLSDKFCLQPELMGFSYNNRFIDRHDYTGSTHLKLGLTYNITKHFGISLTPSIYMNISRDDSDNIISPIKPIKTYYYENVKFDLGYGLGLGIQIK